MKLTRTGAIRAICEDSSSCSVTTNLPGQAGEEPLQGGGVGAVEGRGAERAEFGGGVLEPPRIGAGEDDVGSFVMGHARGLPPDARSAADHHDDLSR
jgi:hypothetical protein